MTTLLETLKTLSTAEEFFDVFNVGYEQRVVDVNRLHILKRLHDMLAEADLAALGQEELFLLFKGRLAQAYQDFVASDARTEKVFRIFHDAEARLAANPPAGEKVFVPLDAVLGLPHERKP